MNAVLSVLGPGILASTLIVLLLLVPFFVFLGQSFADRRLVESRTMRRGMDRPTA